LLAVPPIRPYTDTEWDKLAHIILTDNDDWNPDVLDHPIDDYFDATPNVNREIMERLCDKFGKYFYCQTVHFLNIMILTSRCCPTIY